MQSKSTNKNMIIGITVAAIAVIAIIIGVVIAMTNANKNSFSDAELEEEVETSQVEENTGNADFSNIDVSVAYGDYGTMYAQAKAIQNGEMLGKIISIDGIVSHPMNKYSIVEKDENGSSIGTEFIIEGVEEDSYPQDGDHVVITGVVVEKEPLYFVIKTTPGYVEMIETASEIEE